MAEKNYIQSDMGATDRPTDEVYYRGACSHLKRTKKRKEDFYATHIFLRESSLPIQKSEKFSFDLPKVSLGPALPYPCTPC
jgi:hypothetical protein